MSYDFLPDGMVTTTELKQEIPNSTLSRILKTLEIQGTRYKKVSKGKVTHEMFYTPEQAAKIRAERQRRLDAYEETKQKFSSQWYRKHVSGNDVSYTDKILNGYLKPATNQKKDFWKVSIWNNEHAKFQVIKCSLSRKEAFDMETELIQQGLIARASVHISEFKKSFRPQN